MIPKIIKTEEEYEATLARIDELMAATFGTPEGNELELLVTLVELYEAAAYPIGLPDPIEAIKFRMEQLGLKQKDLVPFFGSRGRVSEVLSGHRPLSLAMVRKLHVGLGIPAEVLLQEPGAEVPASVGEMDWGKFPLGEMLKRRWLDYAGNLTDAKASAEELISTWAAPLGDFAFQQQAQLRQHIRGNGQTDDYALTAWRIRISLLAMEQDLPAYQPETINQDFAHELVKLSFLKDGPLLAREFLQKNGIRFVVEPHLPKTHLDGAALRLPDGGPVVAMTLRYDRIDYFWFTLCHELAHLALHQGEDGWEVFLDDLESTDLTDIEGEADQWAAEALIPGKIWKASSLTQSPTATGIVEFATKHRVHPAIPAGRIRRERRNYKVFSQLVGNGQVRKLFLT
ncbi:MAG: ImmA/IrrE family metallo-endopeptidase [Proteobacteria bacterium]|nr:ImmA/IrrE family metallo-endopeptidase [Pseudomonadota bacterium]MBU1687391.1 ImmA/IrrE family metallo-endopeptidase [Pseudomonadota bacterium]